MANTLSVMTNALRNAVSKQRIRYKENGFNLDLAYICDNIIAMGYPADKLEMLYRNKIIDVYNFFEEYHRDHYKLYNLCLERSYDTNKFHQRVAAYPFEDHNPPTIELIQEFCFDLDTWLKADPRNVAAIHCKAGKGRTGTMICCYLLYSGMFHSAEDALAYFGEKRTKDGKGVTIPSQIRYVQYFSKLLKSPEPYRKKNLQICELRVTETNALSSFVGFCSIYSVQNDMTTDKKELKMNFRKSFTLNLNNNPLPVTGDIKIEVIASSRKKLFQFWFNTYFVSGEENIEKDGNSTKFVYTLNKNEIDDVHKDKEHKYPDDFKVQIVLSECAERQSVTDQIEGKAKSLPTTSQNNISRPQLPMNGSSCEDLSYVYVEKDLSIGNAANTFVTSAKSDAVSHECKDRNEENTPNKTRRRRPNRSQEEFNNQPFFDLYPNERNHTESRSAPAAAALALAVALPLPTVNMTHKGSLQSSIVVGSAKSDKNSRRGNISHSNIQTPDGQGHGKAISKQANSNSSKTSSISSHSSTSASATDGNEEDWESAPTIISPTTTGRTSPPSITSFPVAAISCASASATQSSTSTSTLVCDAANYVVLGAHSYMDKLSKNKSALNYQMFPNQNQSKHCTSCYNQLNDKPVAVTMQKTHYENSNASIMRPQQTNGGENSLPDTGLGIKLFEQATATNGIAMISNCGIKPRPRRETT